MQCRTQPQTYSGEQFPNSNEGQAHKTRSRRSFERNEPYRAVSRRTEGDTPHFGGDLRK